MCKWCVKVCEFESELSAEIICVNNGNEGKFRFVAIVLIFVFVRKTNRRDEVRIEQIERINLELNK